MNTLSHRAGETNLQTRWRLIIAFFAAVIMVSASISASTPAEANPSPVITSISPSTAPAGTTITITGSNFTGVVAADGVKFGTLNSSYTVVNSTTITAVAPANGSGNVAIEIKRADGSVKLNGAFTYKSSLVPTISGVSPTSGTAAGYNTITITGTNFSGVTGASSVRFGTTNAVDYSVLSDTRIEAVVPEGTAGSTVRVYVGATTSVANYTYKSSQCAAGNYLTTRFAYKSSTLTKAQRRDIRDSADELVSLRCEEVQLVKYIGVRKGSSATYKAYLTLQNKRANAVLNVLEKRLETWSIPVTVSEVKRSNQKSQARKVDPDSLKKYRNVLLRVSSSNGIDNVYPSAGPTTGGGTVYITGKGFNNLAETGAVRFGSTISPSYTVNTAGTRIAAQVPSGLAGATNITVQTGVAGTSTAKLYSKRYTYVSSPSITAPTTTPSGSIVGGTQITITGSNFVGVTDVRFGSTNAASFTVNSAGTSITAVSPPGAAGTVAVTVVAAGGQTGTLSFTYLTAPSIDSVSWASSVLTVGGSQLIVTGSSPNVRVEGTTSALSTTGTPSASSITAALASAPVDKEIIVTTPYGVATKKSSPIITNVTWNSATSTLVITGTQLLNASGMTISGGSNIVLSGANATITATQVSVTGLSLPVTEAPITISTNIGTSAAFNFVQPIVTGASLAAGTLTITGKNLGTSGFSLSVGGTAVTGFTSANKETITVSYTAPSAGTYPVVVTRILSGVTYTSNSYDWIVSP